VAGRPLLFRFLALAAFLVTVALALWLAVMLGLPETAPAGRQPMAVRRIAASYALLLSDRRFAAPLSVMLCAQMGIIAFVSSSALAMVQALKLTPTAFSLLFATVMLGQISGGYAGSRLVHHLGIARMVRIGTALGLGAGVVLGTLAWAGVSHWSAVVLPMLVYIFGCAFVIPNATAAALSPFPQIAGIASSLLGVLPFGLGAVVSAVLGVTFDGTTRPMTLAIAIFGLGAFVAERAFFRKLPHG